MNPCELLQNGKETAVGIGPESDVDAGGERLSCFLDVGKSPENTAVRKQDPAGQENFVGGVIGTGYQQSVFAEFLSGRRHDRFQV